MPSLCDKSLKSLVEAVARKTTGYSSVEAQGGGTVHQDIHPLEEDHSNRGKEDHWESSSSKARDKEVVAIQHEDHSQEARCFSY